MQPYSVLLSYPDYMTGGDFEGFYTHIDAENPAHAIDVARADAVAQQEAGIVDDPTDFAVLLVIAGHQLDLKFDV